jgi:hypothetical protein
MLKSTQPVLSTTAMVILAELARRASPVQPHGCRWPICFGESRLLQPTFAQSPIAVFLGISADALVPNAAPV